MGLALLALAAALGDLLLAPSVVNGDGLGYLRAAAVPGALVPGHLAYLPVLRLLRAAVGAVRPVEGLGAARALSVAAAALAVLALGGAAQRLEGRRRAATVAALGLLASHGVIGAGSDVETYAPALAALCVALYALVRRRAGGGARWWVAAAAATAIAALLHVENVLFFLPAAALLPRRDRARLLIAGGALVGAAYAAALATHPRGWLGGATHGFHYPLRATTPAVALYGACKALVFAPYPYEASWARVLGGFAVGAAALAALGWTVAARDPARPTRLVLGRAATVLWAVPYGAVGVAFFASDAERWLFLLPLLWLTVASARRHSGAALGVAGLLLAVNVAVTLPRARDDRWRVRAAQAGRLARAGDLIVSPGHGWDEYIGFYDGPTVEPFPLVYYAGATGGRTALAQLLGERVAAARARGAQVLLVRLVDDGDPMGWKELRQFDVTPRDVGALLPAGARVPLDDQVEALRQQATVRRIAAPQR